jgi:hypothetical protein
VLSVLLRYTDSDCPFGIFTLDNTMTERKRTKGRQEEFEDTKGAIRIRISKKNRQHNDRKKRTKGRQEEFEDTKGR